MPPFLDPDVRFHDDHLKSGGQRAPNCMIKVEIRCAVEDCAEAFVVQAIEAHSGQVLAEGPVQCSDDFALHILTMTQKRPLAQTDVRIRFRCGSTTQDNLKNTIWISCK